ncbi:MAG: NUDIX hydrolase N-terminal domain-containing protein, partial [Clostridium sp.]|nr:NUDIX hydrolase N-terminal domain-containing protein [Clostridium sp.]
DVLKALTSSGYKLGIVTSKTKDEFIQDFYKLEINNYFDIVVCADDTEKHEILYIGDTEYDMNCARLSKIDFALAGWGVHTNKHIQATYYLKEPTDIFTILFSKRNKKNLSDWLKWAMELQFIGQVGLTYSKDNFDIERFQRIREISAEILSNYTYYGVEKINDIFCNETGFQTPKIDTRAAIFNNDKILLVKELDGKWSLPGGWVDVNQSIYSNIIKEVKEEAGLNVIPKKIIAAQDRNKHNYPVYAYGICKVFILCENNGGKFETNIETIESEYFSMDNLPDLALEKNTVEQIKMCFASNNSDKWEALFD